MRDNRIALFALTLAAIGAGAATAGSPSEGDRIGHAHYTTSGSVTNFSASATTVPYYSSQFTDPTNGVTYPYTMVGSDPSKNQTTTIPVVIIPLKFTFASSDSGVNTLDGSTKTALVAASPVFQVSEAGSAASATASFRRFR